MQNPQKKLPTELKLEPLIEAIFEVRLSDTVSPLVDIVPGVLFQKYDPKPILKRLPAFEVPQPIRANDQDLQFASLLRLELEGYYISVGDQSMVISCKMPYPKWPRFKKTILTTIADLANAGIEGKVQRYSVKYSNLIPAPTMAEQIKKVNAEISLANIEVSDHHVNMKVHQVQNEIVHIVSIITGAHAELANGTKIFGIVVDIDSIRNLNQLSFDEFATNLDPHLENLKQANKEKFFDCLTKDTIDDMQPGYE